MANPNIIAAKQQEVDTIAAKITANASTIVVDYRGLNAAQVTLLRKQLREAGVEFQVLKNSIVNRAAVGANIIELQSVLTGPSAVAFSTDAVTPAKILNDFAKENEALKLKGGVVDGQFFDASQLKTLANLPSREGLLSMLLSVMQAPMRNFALAVKAVSEQNDAGKATA